MKQEGADFYRQRSSRKPAPPRCPSWPPAAVGPSTDPSTRRRPASSRKEQSHEGIRRTQGQPLYAVVYEGVDPISGRERRSWHAAGTERADADRLASRLASERNAGNNGARSLSFGAFLSSRWLPGKRLVLATSTYDGYRRNVERHVLPALGRIGLRQLRHHHLEALYELAYLEKGHARGKGWSPAWREEPRLSP